MFNFFSKPQIEERERYFESYEYFEYLEEDGGTSSTQLDKTDFRLICTDRDAMTIPADSFLHVKFRITKSDGTPITEGSVAPVNNAMNLFDRAKYILNEDIVEDIYRPGYVKQVKGLIEYSDDYSRGQGKNELWIPDTLDGLADEGSRIYARNTTNPDLPHYPVELTGADPHVLRIGNGAVDGYANGNGVSFYIKTSRGIVDIDVYTRAYLAAANHELRVATLTCTAGGALVQAAGSVVNDEIIFHANGVAIGGYNANRVGQIVGRFINNATPSIVLNDGDATAGELYAAVGISDNVVNVGYSERALRGISAKGLPKAYNIWFPLRQIFPFLKSNPMIMKGMKQELNFDRNDFPKMILKSRNVPAGVKVIFDRMSWWVPKVKPVLSLQSVFVDFLNSGEQRRLMWDAVNHYRSEPFGANVLESSWLIKTTEHRPSKCIVFFQLNDKTNDEKTNNMIFDHLDCSRIQLSLNSSNNFPEKEYRINFGVSGQESFEDYSRVYAAYLSACAAIHSEDCRPAVSYEDFKTLYPMFVFDLSSLDEGVFETTTQAHLTVNYSLRTEPSGAYRIHAVLDTERDIVISGINGSIQRVR